LFLNNFQLSASKAKSLLEKALASNPHYLPAVYLLAEILEQEMNLDQVCVGCNVLFLILTFKVGIL
jgi:hypothetical protein